MTNHFTTEEVEIGILVVEVAADVSSAVRVRGCGSSLKRSSAAAESVSEMLPLALLLLPVVLAGNLDEVFRWKQLDFEFPSDSARAEALASRRFIPANNIPVGVEAWNDRIFVTVPRWKAGVPASLGFLYRNGKFSKKKKVRYKCDAGDCVIVLPDPFWNTDHCVTNLGRHETRQKWLMNGPPPS